MSKVEKPDSRKLKLQLTKGETIFIAKTLKGNVFLKISNNKKCISIN